MDAVLWQVRRTATSHPWETVTNYSTALMFHSIGYEVRGLGPVEIWKPKEETHVSSSNRQ